MGMESVYKLSVILNLVDNLSGQMNNVQSSVSGSVDKLNSAFGTMQKAGVAMAGIGGTITGLAMKTVTATFDTQNALGELEEDELVGTFISEMALIDEDGDVVAFSNFLAKGKDETEVTFTIEDNY